MNTSQSRTSLFITLALSITLAFLCGTGCRSAGYRKGDVAGHTMQQAAAEVQIETRQIEITLAALKDLVNEPGPDLKPQFQKFSRSLDRLIDSAERTDRTGRHMQLKSAEYLVAWDKDAAAIHYGAIREQSEARKAEVTNQLVSITTRYHELQSVVWPLITYFKDIRTALSVDLTAAGLKSVNGIVTNADSNSQKVQTALVRLSDELTSSGASLSSISTGTTSRVRTEEPPRAVSIEQ